MHSLHHTESAPTCFAAIQESRCAHTNRPVQHPSRWRLLAELVLSPPTRLHRYRNLSVRMLEDTINKIDREKC